MLLFFLKQVLKKFAFFSELRQAPPLAAIFAQKYFILLENCNKLKRKKYLDYERRRMIRWSNFQRDFAESYTFKAKNRLKFA